MVHRLWQRREEQRPSSLFFSWIIGKVQSLTLSIWPEVPPQVYCGRWRCVWRLIVSLNQAGEGARLRWVLEWTQGFSSLYLLDLPRSTLGILWKGERRNFISIPNFAHYSKSRAPCESSILAHFNFYLWKISNIYKRREISINIMNLYVLISHILFCLSPHIYTHTMFYFLMFYYFPYFFS